MSLTLATAPLVEHLAGTNDGADGPGHRFFSERFGRFGRRIRSVLGPRLVADSARGRPPVA